MVSVSEVVKTWQEGFANKDSSKLGEFFTEISSSFPRQELGINRRHWIGLPLVATRRA